MARTLPGSSAEVGGPWNPMPSNFRNTIPSQRFPAERSRYIMYINSVCPWCHRATIVRGLKSLEGIIDVVEVDARDPVHGWYFSGHRGPDRDPIYGVRWLKELYMMADPEYNGRISIPVLWDKKEGTIVNNESADILKIMISGFDALLPNDGRESFKGDTGLSPPHLRNEIDELNAWVFDTVNNGVYKVGFATSQPAYNGYVKSLFQSLDRLEIHLSQPGHHPYLFGDHITEADIRLFTTLIRFDVAYYTLFKCNVKMIRIDYPHLHNWLRRLYWSEGLETAKGVFKNTTHFEVIKRGYSSVMVGNGIVPAGPTPPIMPL